MTAWCADDILDKKRRSLYGALRFNETYFKEKDESEMFDKLEDLLIRYEEVMGELAEPARQKARMEMPGQRRREAQQTQARQGIS